MQKCLLHREEFYIEPFIECRDININEHVTYHDMLHVNRTMYLKHLHWKAKRGNANVKEVFSFTNRPRRRRSLWSLSKVGSNYALICTRGKSGQSIIGGKTWQKTTNFGIEAQVVVFVVHKKVQLSPIWRPHKWRTVLLPYLWQGNHSILAESSPHNKTKNVTVKPGEPTT